MLGGREIKKILILLRKKNISTFEIRSDNQILKISKLHINEKCNKHDLSFVSTISFLIFRYELRSFSKFDCYKTFPAEKGII